MVARRRVSQLPLAVDGRLLERFWSKVRKLDGDDICWLWTGTGRGTGYGCMKVNGVVMDSHVLSWRLANDGAEVPDGKLIAHRCDVRLCVRPDHLFLATCAENMIDARDKGRLEDSWNHGERAPNAVLNADIVREARRLHGEGLGYVRVARQLGVSKHAIKGVLRGTNWRHVN